MRRVLFWIHLTAGCVAGTVILVMSVTGAVLAFEPQVLRFVERQARRVEPRLPRPEPLAPEVLLGRVLEARPQARPASLTLDSDPRAAAIVSAGRDVLYVDPYTGRVVGEGSARWRAFLRSVMEWHRWLGVQGEGRATARTVTGVCNAAFLFLSVSGLFLWWPRQWDWRRVRSVVLFQRGLRGKARDFNWHNVIGLWCAPVIFFLTLTALTISFPAVGNALYPQGPPASAPTARGESAPARESLAGLDAAWGEARRRMPDWTLATLRVPRPGGPVSVSITNRASRGPYGRSQLSFEPRTSVAKWEPFEAFGRGRRTRVAARWTHTGEIFGWPGQVVAAVASLGGSFLAITGLSLAWRRFRAWRGGAQPARDPASVEPAT